MIDTRLLLKTYYLDKMSMFLKNSYGMEDRQDIYFAVLTNVNQTSKRLIYSFDIFKDDDEYFSTLEYDPNSTDCAELDILASLYGVTRTKKIKYFNIEETITMTNKELKFYLQVIITKINYQGSYEELKNLYESKSIIYKQSLDVNDDPIALNCDVLCLDPDLYGTASHLSTLGKLALSDELLIESLGIIYNKSIGQPVIGTFDNALFDIGTYVFTEN